MLTEMGKIRCNKPINIYITDIFFLYLTTGNKWGPASYLAQTAHIQTMCTKMLPLTQTILKLL